MQKVEADTVRREGYGKNNVSYAATGYEEIASRNAIRYRGYYYDVSTKLYYLKSRYYDPEVGRFISADAISELDAEEIDGLNLYRYCANNPVMMNDTEGNAPAWWEWLVSGVLLVAGAVLCATGVGSVLGAGLISAGGSMMASNIMSAAGVDGKVASIISAGLNIVAGVVLCATGVGGALGASMIGSGVGSIGGGFLSEALGFGFQAGAMIGGVVGGIVGGQIYSGVKNIQYHRALDYLKTQGLEAEEAVNQLKNFKGIVRIKEVKYDTVVNRTWGGNAKEIGRWVTPKNYNNPVKKLAIRSEWNTAENTSKMILEGNRTVIVGRAASQGIGYPGGGIQWFVANITWLKVG